MAVIVFNEKTFNLHIKLGVGESFTPNERLEELDKEAKSLKGDFDLLSTRLQKFLNRCSDWNVEHDEDFAKNFKRAKAQREAIEKTKQTKEKAKLPKPDES